MSKKRGEWELSCPDVVKPVAIVCLGVLLLAGFASAEDEYVEVWSMGETQIGVTSISSPPDPLPGVAAHILQGPAPMSAVMLSNVPTSSWTYGCSATSAGMMFGYYDRTGFANMYTGPCNGGVAPLTNLGGQCSIIATKNGFDGRSVKGHVDDYWISYQSTGPDPWEGNWTEHTWADCTADYMGTNQWKWDFIGGDGVKDFNTDGCTALFSYSGSSKLRDYIPAASCGLPQTALCHGLRLFAESRGYQVVENFTQKIHEVAPGGFTFADYMAEIDAGRPVMIQVAGHSMLGVGYDTVGNIVYLHDTWGNYVAQMTWGGSYSGMDHRAVTVLNIVPEPGTLGLLILGGLALIRRRRR